jgi:RNA polymerase sigma-70 factor (ECF subfamily)
MTGTTVEADYDLEAYRLELTAYCYRMLGSAFEAEDAVQDTLVRAWRGLDRFEGRSALRSWLYRIATNVCLTMLGSAQRRARPMDLGPAGSAQSAVPAPLPDMAWISPIPDGRVVADAGDPAEIALARETIRLAFVAALQHLPPRQRAVLILREVLAWSAAEVAELLDTTVASVNSALQRARATLATADTSSDTLAPDDPDQAELLRRYVDAFERYDMDSLTSLLHEDATLSMPPLPLWVRGHDDIRGFMLGTGQDCRGSRTLMTVANATPAFAQYKPGARPGTYAPWSLVVLEITDGRVAGINHFLDTEKLFPLFGFPLEYEAPTSVRSE